MWMETWKVAAFVHRQKGVSRRKRDRTCTLKTRCPRKNQNQRFDYIVQPYLVYNSEVR